MRQTEQGFTVIEGILVIVVLVVIAGVGYATFNVNSKAATKDQFSSATAPITTASTSSIQNIDTLTAQDANNESTIDSTHAVSDQTSAQSSSNAAANVGGSFDESAL